MSTVKESIRFVAEKISPRDPQVRAKALAALDQQESQPLQFAGHAAGAVAWSYRRKFVESFNRWASVVQAVVVCVCFAFASPQAGLYALGAVLIALAFRDAYTHRNGLLPDDKYMLDSAGDAATAGVFLISSQGLAVVALPPLALPTQVLYRGLLVAMPLIATLRMVLRPKPLSGPEDRLNYDGPPAKELYRRTRWLNFFWLVTVYGVVVQNVTDKHGYFPDFLRGMLPVVTFVAWKATQADDLCRRDNLVTLFTSVKAKMLRRMRGKIATSLPADNVNYSTFMFFRLMLFGVIALELLAGVEPFLFGEPLMQSIWRATGAILAFSASMLSWKYVKASNRAAARALLLEARREEAKTR